MVQHANTVAANPECRKREVCWATEWSVGGFDELTTRTRIYLDIDRRTDEPYRLSIELPAMAKCRRSAFEHSTSTMAQERLSSTIDIQFCRTKTNITVNRLPCSLTAYLRVPQSSSSLKLYCIKKKFSA